MNKKPSWLKVKYKADNSIALVENLVSKMSLRTVCDQANCPNRLECFNDRTATFMILGNNCTRNCTFCNVSKEIPMKIDADEPENLAKAVVELNLKHVVVTSVTRDDLSDGGASQFVEVIQTLKALPSKPRIEVLIPDFQGNDIALRKVVSAEPDVIAHNVETVNRLYDEVRPMANYKQSLEVLSRIKELNDDIYTKSGIMLGLGETEVEVTKVLNDLRKVKCDFITIGQYLAPSKKHHEVIEYIEPKVFDQYKEKAYELGFSFVASAPLVRSSYQAHKAFEDDSVIY